jgi:iron complex outermembrane receptor protein
VNRLKELVPSVQLYASNARNTTLNIRGLGSPFGLTNDGVDPGVGFYVDGVYYARPAATALDFIDIERVEVLRGPQGTLFGKNTTAGAFNITTRAASFTPGANFELSYGNFGFVQAKGSLTGALSKKLAARVSFTGTQRNGFFLTRIPNYL